MLQDVHIELSLAGEPREREVAAPYVPDPRLVLVALVRQVQLRVERVGEVQPDLELARLQLSLESQQPLAVSPCGRTDRELAAELLGHLLPQADRRLVVHAVVGQEAQLRAQLLVRQSLHADHQPTARTIKGIPGVEEGVYALPSPEVEVADAEVSSIGVGQRVL